MRLYSILAAAVLVWLNAYICREFFTVEHTAHMNSMHGFWMAIARHASVHWFLPTWWPWWDGGMPFEFTYSPVFPGAMALWSRVSGVSAARAFHVMAGVVYCVSPVALFALILGLSRSVLTGFAGGVIYTLLTPVSLLLPDGVWAFGKLDDARRLYLVSVWDDAPHAAGLAVLAIALLVWIRMLERRRARWLIGAAVTMALCVATTAFGVTDLAVCSIAVVVVYGAGALRWTIPAACLSYLLVCPVLPPSLGGVIRYNSRFHDGNAGLPSLTALAIILFGLALLWPLLRRWTDDKTLQFFAITSYLFVMIPLLSQYLGKSLFPQPGRYKMEADMMLAGLLAAAGGSLRLPRAVRVTGAAMLVCLAVETVVDQRRFARDVLRSQDVTSTVEYRVANWLASHYGQGRVAMTGSIAQWANAFTDLQQFGGSSYSTAWNRWQQDALQEMMFGDTAAAITYLKAYGVQAVAIPGPQSSEFWKSVRNPERYGEQLQAVWEQDGVKVYDLGQRSPSLVHVVPSETIIRKRSKLIPPAREFESYVAALHDESPDFRWSGVNSGTANVRVAAGQTISVQINYHPGWTVLVDGRSLKVSQDALGLMYLPGVAAGNHRLELHYSGGTELWICRAVSAITAAGLMFSIVRLRRRPYSGTRL